jgi:hypothetical protein
MSPQRGLKELQKEVDRPTAQHSEVGVATVWLAFYVLLISAAVANFRAGGVIEIAATLIE